MSIYFLNRAIKVKENEYEQFYEEALRETIRLGGDTDTNACIVGALVGAFVGIKSIPNHMIEKLIQFDC